MRIVCRTFFTYGLKDISKRGQKKGITIAIIRLFQNPFLAGLFMPGSLHFIARLFGVATMNKSRNDEKKTINNAARISDERFFLLKSIVCFV